MLLAAGGAGLAAAAIVVLALRPRTAPSARPGASMAGELTRST